MSKLILSTLLCLMLIAPSALCQDVNINDLLSYNKWRYNNKRVYLNDEEQIYRQQVFFENLNQIKEHSKNKQATYSVGLNQFSDMTNEEFKEKILNNNRMSFSSESNNNRLLQKDSAVSNKQFPIPPVSIDWRTRGILTPIQNQGTCGSCWTFSVIGGIESFYAITNKKVEKFSEQQLVDCASTYRTNGCNGGFQEDGVRYAIKNGVVRADKYPYIAFKSFCKVGSVSKPQTIAFQPKKFQPVPPTSEGLKSALAFSPVIATVNADTWQNYTGGVFNNCREIGMSQLNHAIVAVGYDAYGNWIIRNTWGVGWGESGYMKLAAGNTCGILVDNLIITE